MSPLRPHPAKNQNNSTGEPSSVSSGYSKKTLIEKLGIRPGDRISLQNQPDHYTDLLGPLPDGARIFKNRAKTLDFLQLFVKDQNQMKTTFPLAKKRIKPDGILWVSWPKQSSHLRGDLKEDLVREIGLANGLVDVKVAVIDQDWSGLKFVYRLADRPNLLPTGKP